MTHTEGPLSHASQVPIEEDPREEDRRQSGTPDRQADPAVQEHVLLGLLLFILTPPFLSFLPLFFNPPIGVF